MSERPRNDAPASAEVGGLLQTVGGTSAPIVFAIRHVRPRAAVLVCSEDSQITAVQVKRLVREEMPMAIPEIRTVLVTDPTDLVACHQAAVQGLRMLRDGYGLTRDEIRIDFSGGTKAMAAAAVLAAAPDGYQFLYVSGQERDRQGLGNVTTGTEVVRLSDNPWLILEEPELGRLLDMAAQGQWAAAMASCGKLADRATDATKPLFETLARVLDGLRAWDHFEHERAWQSWQQGHAVRRLADMAQVTERPAVQQFAKKCESLQQRLGPLAKARTDKGLQKRDALVLDMLANGNRQAARGNYDEAALRYYRAIELTADRLLSLRHQIDNSSVPEAAVPEPLREEFRNRKGPAALVWKLGLYESVQLLAALNDPLGKRLLDHLDRKRLDSEARNQNWLIHGEDHVDEKRFAKFKENVLAALDLSEDAVPSWPDFRP